jgi:hypothetical protein
MKTHLRLLVVLFVLLAGLHRTGAQGTAFTYQGRLNDGAPANGSYDLLFILYNSDVGGSQQGLIQTNLATPVSNGLFTATMDFGNVFDGSARWLEIHVRTNNNGLFIRLDPRQSITASPYAIMAGNLAPGAGLSGTYGNAVTLSNANNSFSGTFTGNGANLTNLNASALGGLGATNFWTTTGNSGTSPDSGNFLGTADNQPLELWVNGMRAMRYEFGSNTNGAPNVVGGSPVNFVSSGVIGAVIAGGGATNLPGVIGTKTNSVSANFGTVGGGKGNQIQSNASYSTIAGGFVNLIQSSANASAIGGGNRNQILTNASDATIAGGFLNFISANANQAAIGGGRGNNASGLTSFIGGGGDDGFTIIGNTNAGDASVIGGGVFNLIQTIARNSFIGGGHQNQIQSSGNTSVVAGGDNNVVAGIGSFIGGGGYDGVNVAGNTIAANDGVIGGGMRNQILVNGRLSVIGGGDANQISSTGFNAAIVGGYGNFVSAAGAFIGGGGYDGTNLGGNTNRGRASVIDGGFLNSILANADYSVIGGGSSNRITVGSDSSTIGGGRNNTNSSENSVLSGGIQNQIQLNAPQSTISGGSGNQIQTNAPYATISGGSNNIVSGSFGSIPGGDQNMATTNSFAAGHRAKAIDQGAFVWADATDSDFSDSGTNTFDVRASGGVTFTDGAGHSVSWVPSAGSWAFTSDRNTKENFKPVDAREILDKVAQLPLTEWNYKGYADRHVGPMAQDFQAAFPLNANNKMLNSADEAGVTLAAIQGLNQKLEQKETEIAVLKARLDKLEQLLNSKIGADR